MIKMSLTGMYGNNDLQMGILLLNMTPTRFVQELGRQFRLDLRDDEARKETHREESTSNAQEATNVSQDGGSGEETRIKEETPEKCDPIPVGKVLIGKGQKRRTWIEAPLLYKDQAREEEEEDVKGISKEGPNNR